MSNKKEFVIWSNYDLDYEDFRDQIEEAYPEASEAERFQLMHEINDDYLDDERINLNINTNKMILVIADFGLWDGRKNEVKQIRGGNIRDCLYTECEYAKWYVDDLGDFRCKCSHHDGTNYYLYRIVKSGISNKRIYNLIEKIKNGTATRRNITDITEKIGPYIQKVYGFNL